MNKNNKNGNILSRIRSPKDLKKFTRKDLNKLACQVRKKIIEVTSATGGHLASSLGSVELTIALHYCLNAPKDKILWDVGHQAYAHKILTGRLPQFDTLRQLGGLSGFPNKDESEYDVFTCGHSSTSISNALGLITARDLRGESWKAVAVIGDASLGGGMAFEALNHAGHTRKDVVVVLNDNEHSISRSVGALSKYLNRIIINPLYNRVRREMQKVVKSVPIVGMTAFKAARKFEEGLKNLITPGMLFEEMGFRYFGPFDGHNINQLISAFRSLFTLNEPILIHLITKKGKGYKPAEKNPSQFHSTGPFNVETGENPVEQKEKAVKKKTFTEVFSESIVEMAKSDHRIVAISAAMPDGTGLTKFSREFPERFFDVGIAEQHAVGFSAGLAKAGFKPVVSVYSTFLQRGYDQIVHDVCLQNIPVVFCLDRAGLVGEDGPTHHGVFDIAYLRHIPNIVVMAPRDGFELGKMLELSMELDRPVAIRYPRGSAESHLPGASFEKLKLGKSEVLRKGKDISIFAIGSMVSIAVRAADLLSEKNVEATVVNARFAKPLDKQLIEKISKSIKKFVILEEGVEDGGFGSAILEFMERENIKGVRVKRIGLPDEFIEHGAREELFKKYHLTADGICETILQEVI